MSWFDDAVNEGVREGMRTGFEEAWTDQCAGRDEPSERCPMRLADGCACYWRAYHEAPFWRRWRMEKPRCRPSQKAVIEAMIQQRIEEVAPRCNHAIRSRGDERQEQNDSADF